LDRIHLQGWLYFKGMDAAYLARAIGVTESYISMLISGEKDNPTLVMLGKIARGLGIPVGLLFTHPQHLGVPVPVSNTAIGALKDIEARVREKSKKPHPGKKAH